MKKFVAMMVLVILAMSMIIAHGEMHYRTAKWSEESHCKIDENGDEHYYVFATADGWGYSKLREVSKTFYYELLDEETRDEEYHNNLWYVKAWDWTTTAASNVADFVVFWD